MLNFVLNLAVGLALKRSVRERVRLNGIKAVRGYVAAVGKARLGAMAVVGLIAGVALCVAGFVLAVGALIAMIPMSESALRMTALVIGFILLLSGLIAFAIAFSQRRWLTMSRSYELMEAVMEPVPSTLSVPKNLIRAVKREPTVHAPRETIERTHPAQYRSRSRLEPSPV
ncbi:MAG: hypothetical protein NDI61_04765 [Bdellovibrionaceae bacterium]|nr:hypothetical protein [Pseudobdellovibrionaceae bacterium]